MRQGIRLTISFTLAALGMYYVLLLCEGDTTSKSWKSAALGKRPIDAHTTSTADTVSDSTTGSAFVSGEKGTFGMTASLDGNTWLIAGSDSRKGEVARSDALLLVRMHQFEPHVLVLSIPRDMRVLVPGHGYTKVNHALAYGGLPLLRQSVQNALGIKIDHALAVNFHGFVTLVDALGGVTVYVDKPLHYDDETDETHIHLLPGWKHITGQQALDFVRFRHDAMADTGRMQRQQRLLSALARTSIPFSRWQAVARSALALPGDVHTDASVWTVLSVLHRLSTMHPIQVKSRLLTGTNRVDPRDGLWYFYLDPRERLALRGQIALFDRGH